ncbi:MAG: hypothetical protein ABMA64_23420 [Myxococcota bacterium]
MIVRAMVLGGLASGCVEEAPVSGTGCGFGEPNDTVDAATPVDVDGRYTDLCVTGSDGDDPADWFVLTAPADAAGGVVTAALENVRDGGLAEFSVIALADGGSVPLNPYSVEFDQPVSGWFTVAPGASYAIGVVRFAGTGPQYTYDLRLDYQAIPDPQEPNPKESPTAIELGQDIRGSFAGVTAASVLQQGEALDAFTFDLSASTVRVSLTDVPADLACDVELFDAAGLGVGEAYQTDPGLDCVIDAESLEPGSYTAWVHVFAGEPPNAGGGEAPGWVTAQYTLRVD